MADKHVTLEQLEMLARKGKIDSLVRIIELQKLVIDGLKGTQHVGITVSLPSANWVDRVQTAKNELLLADSRYWYYVSRDEVCVDAGVKADDITVNGEVTFRCEKTPVADLTVNILRLEVNV